MPAALCAMSHSPLMGKVDPAPEVADSVNTALERAREFVRVFSPDLVVAFAPDHYNGFFYEVMPQFCIGASATSIGDYGTPAGQVSVDTAAARRLSQHVLDAGVDAAHSEAMRVDHGLVQPLQLLFGDIDAVPVVPVFINCVAEPLGPALRAVALGRAIGEAMHEDPRRVLFLASGGLSHDPPVPRLTEATPEVAERLTVARVATREERAVREAGTEAAARSFAAGATEFQDLNPAWDQSFLEACASADLEAVASMPVSWFTEQAGHSAHEVRTWLAAYAALGAQGRYEVRDSFYTPIREWFAGYAVTTAAPIGE